MDENGTSVVKSYGHPGAVKWNDLQKGGGEMGKVNISEKLHNATH
jgi:hypothetical protein